MSEAVANHRWEWFGIAWFGIAWFGIAWFGIAWFGIAWFGIAASEGCADLAKAGDLAIGAI